MERTGAPSVLTFVTVQPRRWLALVTGLAELDCDIVRLQPGLTIDELALSAEKPKILSVVIRRRRPMDRPTGAKPA